MLPEIRTARLRLAPVSEQHVDHLIELNSDPEVMLYIRGRAASRDETLAEWRQRLEHQSDPARGLGYWAGFEGDTFVGWWSASSFEGRPKLSGIGYRLRTASWGRGLATEGARAMIHQAFSAPDIERVFASTMAVNTLSRRVLDKLGMTHTSSWVNESEEPVPGSKQGEVGYELTRAEWERERSTPVAES